MGFYHSDGRCRATWQAQLNRHFLASYQRNRDLVSVGAYAAGSDPLLDKAIALYPQMEIFLQQGMFERSSYEDACQHLKSLFPG